MASLAFQPFVDKENAGSIGVRPNKGQTGGGLGKVFNKGNAFATPRRALGDVGNKTIDNGTSHKQIQKPSVIPLQNKGLQMKSSNVQPLSSRSGNVMQKPTVNENIKKKVLCSTKVTTKPEPISHRKPDVEDIEYMHIPNEEEDDFEDIWPKSERISTYIKKLVTWRPPCLFGDLPESDDDEDEETEERERIVELNRILESSVAKYSLDKTEMCGEEIPALDLVPDEYEEIPLPCLSLDNTLDIMSNIGPLELKE